MDKLFIFDTNILISATLIGGTSPANALDRVFRFGRVAFSSSTFNEFAEVLFRKKFDKYFLSEDEKWGAITRISSNSDFFSPTEEITICRDPKDNKFLELAITAKATCIITGDEDLLALNPFRGIPIVNANDFLIMKF